jgi:hypothetical protein
LREDKAVGADADDLAFLHHLRQYAAKVAAFRDVQAKLVGQFVAAERMIVRGGEKRLDFLTDVH